MLNVTSIKVYPVNANEGKIVANVSLTIDDELVVYVKLMSGKYGYFLSYPNHSYINENNEKIYKDDVFILHKDTIEEVINMILDEMEKPKKDTKRGRR